VLVTRVRVRDLRSYATADAALGPGLNVVHGPNGAGKTNLLEAVYFGCTGRSCRTSNERELIRFGAELARVELDVEGDAGAHRLSAALPRAGAKRLAVDGQPVEGLVGVARRPLASVFIPDRLELIKGPPGLRRSHVDSLVAALWPARATARRDYARALAQRNALLARARASAASTVSLGAWDAELAACGVALRAHRAEAIAALGDSFCAHAARLGLRGEAALAYRPRSAASTAAELAAELAARVESDLERGFTGHGPHRDEVSVARAGRELRVYGSQGEQRLALLALLLAERDLLAERRGAPPLLLLDDVMSELDADRRELLAGELTGRGQVVVTATELAHVPGATRPDVARLAVGDGRVLSGARAA
jgi:DNA replication and repair protein RecF